MWFGSGCFSSFMCCEARYQGACDTNWPLKKPQVINPTVIAASTTRTVKAVTRRLELPSSLTRKNKPLNRLTTVAISIRAMAALSMVRFHSDGRAMKTSIASAIKDFRPGLAPTLVVLVLLPLMVGLGFWQLARGHEKQQLVDSYAERRVAEPINSVQLNDMADPAFRRVRLRGQFDAEHSVLLDNRMRDGRAGVELLQPFHDQASGLWLLLNRGWLPWPDRRTPPVFTTPDQPLNLDAWVYVAPGETFQLHADPATAQWPRLLTALHPAALRAELGRSGFAYELRAEAGPGMYETTWPIVAMGPEKHLAYAVQWFAMALALLSLYLYLGWHNAKEKHHGSGHESTQHV